MFANTRRDENVDCKQCKDNISSQSRRQYTQSTYIMQRYLHQTTIYFIFKLSLRFYCFTIVLIAINVMPLRSSVGAIEISDNDDDEEYYDIFHFPEENRSTLLLDYLLMMRWRLCCRIHHNCKQFNTYTLNVSFFDYKAEVNGICG